MKQTQLKPVLSVETENISNATLNSFVGYHLKRVSNAVLNDLAVVLKPFGLRMLTYTALVLIVDNPGLRQFQLAQVMDIERPNLVVLIDELERQDFILRQRVPTDRRAYALYATPAGLKLYQQSLEAVRAHEQALLKGIDPETQQAIITAALQIQKNLS